MCYVMSAGWLDGTRWHLFFSLDYMHEPALTVNGRNNVIYFTENYFYILTFSEMLHIFSDSRIWHFIGTSMKEISGPIFWEKWEKNGHLTHFFDCYFHIEYAEVIPLITTFSFVLIFQKGFEIFNVNPLLDKRFMWNFKLYFLWKIRRKKVFRNLVFCCCVSCFNTYHAMGRFSRWQTDDFFLFFPRK